MLCWFRYTQLASITGPKFDAKARLALYQGYNRVDVSKPPHHRMETDQVSETSCSLVFFKIRAMEKVKKTVIVRTYWNPQQIFFLVYMPSIITYCEDRGKLLQKRLYYAPKTSRLTTQKKCIGLYSREILKFRQYYLIRLAPQCEYRQ
jgi:hypothetical protein